MEAVGGVADMKVYVTFFIDAWETIMDKAFVDENKAREYVALKNKTTSYGWIHQELEVEE
jgi:hypothetical protein